MKKKILIALAIYLTALFASNTLGIKLMPFLFGTHLSTAVFVFPFVFLMTDVIGEVYGKKMSRLFVLAGFISMVFFTLANLISNIMPASADFTMKAEYDTIFYMSLRFTFASLIAFIVGEYQDVFSFFFLKAKMGGKYFWLRSNLSNLWGQLLDSVIWASIAYIGIFPIKTIIMIIIPWWLYKFAMGVLYTPLSYLGIWLLKRGQDEDMKIEK
ncbi:MAG: queuosine precursor transporter [Patescibacteria group bacterium]|jgi:hypothetical protein